MGNGGPKIEPYGPIFFRTSPIDTPVLNTVYAAMVNRHSGGAAII